MISRRDAVKLGSTGLAIPSLAGNDLTALASDLPAPHSNVHTHLQAPTEQDGVPSDQGPSLDQPIVVRWRFEVPQVLATVPQFHEQVVLFGTGAPSYTTDSGAGTFWALDSESGEVLWSLPSQATGWSQPDMADDLIYVGSALVGYNAHHSEYHAIDLATGAELWRLDFEGPMRTKAEIVDDLIVVETNTADPYAPGEPGIYIVERSTGTILWTILEPRGWINRGSNFSGGNHAIHNGNIIIKNDNGLVALDLRTAQEVWRFQPGTGSDGIVTGNTAVIDFSEGISAIDLETGSELWRLRASAFIAGYHDNVVVARGWSDNGVMLIGLDHERGELLWTNDLARNDRDLRVVDGAVFLLSYGDNNELLSRFDITTGELVWEQPVSEDFELGVIDDENIVAGGFNQPIRAFDSNSGQQLWQTEDDIGTDAFFNLTEQLVIVSESTSDFIGLDRESGTVRFRYQVSSSGNSTHPGIGNGLWVISGTSEAPIVALGNMPPIKLVNDTEVRAAPSSTAIVRGTEGAGTEISLVGAREQGADGTWVEVMINGSTGWIPLEAIDPATLPPEGDIEYVYIPE